MLCNVNRNNSLSFLLHNFSGYLTLNKLLKESYLNTSSNRKLLVFAGNVIRFEYRYKFEDINLRALRPKQNELYIFVDFGLKSVLQFKSVDFYKNEDNLNIQTSDRVYALFRTLDKHFEDQAIFVCPYNKDNMNLFFSENTANQNNSILLNLRNSKFFVDNTFFANLLFSYTGFLEHLSFHYSFFQFYAIHLNTLLFSFYCKIALSQALPVVSLVNNFFNRYYYFNESSYLGFFWREINIDNNPLSNASNFNLLPVLLKDKIIQRDSFFLQRRNNDVIKKSSFNHFILPMSNDDDDFDEDSADCVDTSFVYQLHKSFKVFMKKFIFNKFKKNVFNLNQNFFLRVFYIFYSKIVDFDEVSQFFNSELRMSKIFDRLYSFIKHNINRIKQYNLFSSYIFNYGKFPIKKYYTTDIFYVDKSSFVFKLNQSKKNTKTRFFNFFFKKRVYVLFSKLRTFKLLKYKCLPQLRIKKSIVSGKSRKWTNKKISLPIDNLKVSKRLIFNYLSRIIGRSQFILNNWITNKLQITLFNFLGLLPRGYTYNGFVEEEMYLYYKQLITGTSLQVTILSLSLKYLWLTSYFSLLLKKNINNTQFVKKYNNHLFDTFSYKVQPNKYLAFMLNAFNYSLAINMKIINFITAPKTDLDRHLGTVKDLTPIPSDKKGAQFWRTIRTDFIPNLRSKFNLLDESALVFISYSLSFILLYHLFMYQKRFFFSIGSLFWQKLIMLKQTFKWLFVKETVFNLVFYKNYFVYFFDLIKKNKHLFLCFVFYTFKFNSNFLSTTFFKKSSKFLFSSLKFFIVSKINLMNFIFPFFLNSMYNFILPTNLFFYTNFSTSNKTYNNYVYFYKKLSFYKSNLQLNNSFDKSKNKHISNLILQPFFFNIVALKNMFDFKQLFYFWNWQLDDSIKVCSMYKFLTKPKNAFLLFDFILFDNIFDSLKKNQVVVSKIKKPFIISSFCLNKSNFFPLKTNNVISLRRFSTMKNTSFILTVPNNYLRVLCRKRKNKSFFWRKKKRFYILNFFTKIKKKISKSFLKIVKKTQNIHVFLSSQKRLVYLFEHSGFFSIAEPRFFKKFLFTFANKLFCQFGISKKVLFFCCNSILFLISIYNLKFDFRILRISLFWLIYFSFVNLKKRYLYNNKTYFFNILKKFFIPSIKNFFFVNYLNKVPQSKFLAIFATKANFSYFIDSKNIFKIFYKQHFHIYNKYKDSTFFQVDNKIGITNLFTRKKSLCFENEFNFESNSFFQRNISFTFFLKRCSEFLQNTGFFAFGQFKILKLLFFPFLSKSVNDISIYKRILKFKQRFNFSNSTVYFCFKRIRYFIFLLNHLFNFSNEKELSFVRKNIFWLNLLLFFKISFNYFGYKKALLYKYNFNLFKKKVFTNKFLVKKTFLNKSFKKAFIFLCSYDRFHKLPFLGFINRASGYYDSFRFGFFSKSKCKSFRKKSNLKRKFLLFSFTRYVRLRHYLLNYRKFGFYFSKFFFWIFSPFLKGIYSSNFLKLLVFSCRRKKELKVNSTFLFDKFYFFGLRRILKNKFKVVLNKNRKLKKINLRRLYNFWNPRKIRITNLYSTKFLIGSFFRRPINFCLTTKKRVKMKCKSLKIYKRVNYFLPLWKQRSFFLLQAQQRKFVVRSDLVYSVKHFRERNKYLTWNSLRETYKKVFYLTNNKIDIRCSEHLDNLKAKQGKNWYFNNELQRKIQQLLRFGKTLYLSKSCNVFAKRFFINSKIKSQKIKRINRKNPFRNVYRDPKGVFFGWHKNRIIKKMDVLKKIVNNFSIHSEIKGKSFEDYYNDQFKKKAIRLPDMEFALVYNKFLAKREKLKEKIIAQEKVLEQKQSKNFIVDHNKNTVVKQQGLPKKNNKIFYKRNFRKK